MKRGILAVLAALSFAAAGCATLYGAAAGASIGALAGDAGKGAAIGASIGAVIDIID